jgi:hypothetical protein
LRVHKVQPSIAAVDGPARSFVPAQQTLLVEARVGAGTVELVAAVEHTAQAMTALLASPPHHLLERGDDIHIIGNQRHRRLPDVVIKTSHHEPPLFTKARLVPLFLERVLHSFLADRYLGGAI